ncbi:predicted protein [Sclerotinia sclerotiorum 1980 UF-70]|uniref:Uncharacterized protein n=1 Tax=Sclerotinia sclerotiorum (strain ATCC 18683 / 1980 / Ss-1) TaxID=665079 RepID=A7EHM0_SCLS1|nr:predicted protein [Sclerotinia sclerotiorum 1980 UF-70]EDO02336.1 predicted protein [Sclerotinia sclerotiorum 1980 UF-70]
MSGWIIPQKAFVSLLQCPVIALLSNRCER